MKPSTVCVTGGAGFIGSCLIMRLLERGYSVQATVRPDPESKKDISHLKILPGASERLKIFNADLNKPESFIPAIEGCEGVFHTTHPIDYAANIYNYGMVNMAVEGLRGILQACLNSKTVKRVVYTSSIVTLMYNENHAKVFDETSWTDVDFMRNTNYPRSSYSIPKTLAEKEALRFSEDTQLEVVTIIRPMVVSPFICPHFPTSNSIALSLFMGNKSCIFLAKAQMVHVDDLVSGHIYLLECPEAKGRYICSSTNIGLHTLVEFLSTRYKEYKIPMDLVKDIGEVKPLKRSSNKLLDLGFNFKIGLEEMYDGAIHSCKEKGFL